MSTFRTVERRGRVRAMPALGFVVTAGWMVSIVAVLVGCSGGTDPVAGIEVAPAPRFVDETVGSGVDHSYEGGFEFFVGGGVAVFDCDDDAFPDLFAAGGTDPAVLYRNESEVGGSLRFSDAGDATTSLVDVTGAYPIDIDSDRNVDLMVLRRGSNVLLRGLGDCRFEDATESLAADGGEAWTVGFSATWESGQALPTLVFANYLEMGSFEQCDTSVLLRPAGEVYGSPIELSPGDCALSALFSDWSRTGRRDLRLANDRHYYVDGGEQLWRIEPGRPPTLYAEADGWHRLQIWGMGIASQDLTGDGIPEVFITSQGDNKLQTLAAGVAGPARPDYVDIALRLGATAHRPYTGGDVLPSTAWHPEFGDVNDDGFVDLLITKGNVEAQPDFATDDPTNLLIGQADGTFVEGGADAGIAGFERARGAALADLNRDGWLDLVVVHREAPMGVWRNTGSVDSDGRHWVEIRLRQPGPNGDAIGAWIDVRQGDRSWSVEWTIGGGHAGGELGWAHVGVPSSEPVDVQVRWPDGTTESWQQIGVDGAVEITRGGAPSRSTTP